MNRRGYDLTRRNRNIGTAKAGHGRDNRLVIPGHWADLRMFYEKLDDPVIVSVAAGNVALRILVEPPLSGFAHACTIDDILHLLGYVPARHFKDIRVVVLRQPKRKQRILRPAWGRLVYFSDLEGYSGPAIYLEAQDLRKTWSWSKSLGPDQARELERLREDGHRITTDRRRHAIASTLDSVRSTQLFRTLPHEIGHYVDFLEKSSRAVTRPAGTGARSGTTRGRRRRRKPLPTATRTSCAPATSAPASGPSIESGTCRSSGVEG